MKPLHWIVAGVVTVFVLGLVATISGISTQMPDAGSAVSSKTTQATSMAQASRPEQSEVAETAAEQAQHDAFMRSLATRKADDPAAIGSVDAPLVVIEWSDYRCPFCSAFNEQTLPQLLGYVEAGKVRFEFRDLAVFGEDSEYAAVAARAAGKQDKQIDFMNALFAKLPDEGHPPVDEAVVTEVAKQIGIPDLAQFKTDLASEDLRNQVLAQSEEATQLGLSSVPVFVVGTQAVLGAQPVEAFTQLIEEELAKVGA